MAIFNMIGGGTQDYKVEFGVFSHSDNYTLYAKTKLKEIHGLYFMNSANTAGIGFGVYDKRKDRLYFCQNNWSISSSNPYISGGTLNVYIYQGDVSFYAGDTYYYCAIGK